MIKRDSCTGPEGGEFRRAVAEKEISAWRDDDGVQFTGRLIKAGHVRAVGALGVLVQIGVTWETCGDPAHLALRGVVIHHHHHSDLIGCVSTSGRSVWITVIAAFESEVIAVGPAALLDAAGKVIVDFEDVRDAGIAKLAEVLCVGVTGKSTAGFAESFGFVVTVRINQTHTFAGHVKSVLPLLLGSVVAVVTVGVGDTQALSKATSPR